MTEEGQNIFQRIDLPWIDTLGLGLIGVFLLLGIWRGLWWQVIRLVGVIGAVAVARGLAPRFTPTVESAFDLSEGVASGLVWFVLFLCGLVIASLLGMIGKKALEAMQLGLLDRAGGGLAGALTGAILHSALLVLLTALGTAEWTSQTLDGSRSAVMLNGLTHKLPVLVDAQAAERIVGPWAKIFNGEDAPTSDGD
jgi:membrane protein required for colicin V production